MGVDITLLAKWLLFHISEKKTGKTLDISKWHGILQQIDFIKKLDKGFDTHTKDFHDPESMRFPEDIYPYAD